MKILLIGEIYSNNLGDQLVYETTRYQLEQIYPNASFEILDIMGRNKPVMKPQNINHNEPEVSHFKEYVRNNLGKNMFMNHVLSIRSARCLKSYYEKTIQSSKFDLAVFTGGQLVSDMFVEYIYFICKILSMKSIPYVFNAVGLGVINKISIQRYKKIFSASSMKAITCRSNADDFNRIFFDSDEIAVETFDTAVSVRELYNRNTYPSNEIVGLGIMYTTRIPRVELLRFWTELIERLECDKINWKIFTTGCTQDYYLALDVLNSLQMHEKQKDKLLFDIPTSSKELVENIQEFSMIVSFRLHSHIIAYSYSIPSVAIYWDNKLVDFFKKINRNNHVFKINCNIDGIVSDIHVNLGLNGTLNNEDEMANVLSNLKKHILKITSLSS